MSIFRISLYGVLIVFDSGLIASDKAWVGILGCLILTLILLSFEKASVRRYRQRLMPFTYHCLPCHNRGDKCEFRSSSEETLHQFIQDHNRTTHLMEP